MNGIVHIGEAARRLGVTPEHLRTLERQGRIPLARRDFIGRTYSESDLTLLRSVGVGSRPKKLKRAEEVLGMRGV
jgi:DNA-binding transcriptional MerR regulator